MLRPLRIPTDVEVLQKKLRHWLRHCGTYRSMVQRGYESRDADVQICEAKYQELIVELRALEASGDVRALRVLKSMPMSATDPAGPRIV